MRYEWLICKYKNGVFIDKSPMAMGKGEAEDLCRLCNSTQEGFTFKVKHKRDFEVNNR